MRSHDGFDGLTAIKELLNEELSGCASCANSENGHFTYPCCRGGERRILKSLFLTGRVRAGLWFSRTSR